VDKQNHRHTKDGFTLVEAMTTTVVLALGAVLIHEAFFISLDSYHYYTNYLNVLSWMDEKIWQVQDHLSRLGPSGDIETHGGFTKRNKNFEWGLSHHWIDEAQGLCEIDLALSWEEGQRKVRLSRTAYARYQQRQ
jgi:hypothetical protein